MVNGAKSLDLFMAQNLMEFARSMSQAAPQRKRTGRPPGNPPPRIDWSDPQQRRAYKAQAFRKYCANKRAELIAQRKKPCTGPLCNGAIKSFDEFEPDSTKPLGIQSRCRACKNYARRARYQAQLVRERQKAHDYYTDNQGRIRKRARGIRAAAIAVYGGQCELCGGMDNLEFDHVNGDGGEHRKIEAHWTMLRRIATGGPIADYQLRLLCSRCHHQLGTPSPMRLRLIMASANNWPVW